MALWNYTSYSPIDTFVGVNTLTAGLFGVSIVVLVWLLIFFRQSTEPNRDRIVAANFVSSFVALFFGYLGIVNDYVIGTAVVLLIGSIALLMTRPTY